MHILVIPTKRLLADRSDKTLLLAWNFLTYTGTQINLVLNPSNRRCKLKYPFAMEILSKGKIEPAQWIIAGGVLVFAAVFVFYPRHTEWLIRVGLIEAALLAFFYSSKPLAKWTISISVLSLSFFAVFYLLGEGSLHDWDEAIYAQVAKEIAVSDNWLTLTWAGHPFWHKPPLYFWLTAVIYKMVGINEFAARICSAAFGFGVVALTFWLGLRLFSWTAGLIAGLLLLSIDQSTYCHWHNFVCQARVGMLETMLTSWLILSLILVWEANERPRLIVLIGITAGLAVMTKAWIGFFALAGPLLYALVTGQFHARRNYWSLAILLAAAIILPWHVWQIWIHGNSFLRDYLVVNLFSRLTDVVEEHRHSPLFYFSVLRDGFSIFGSGYLWPAAYLWAAWTAPREQYRQKVLLLTWVTIPLLLLSLAQTKLPWYVMLIYPGIALLISAAITEVLRGTPVIVTCALIGSLFYFRLPAVVDGSPDVKQFAQGVTQMVSSHEPIYVYREDDPGGKGNTAQHKYPGAQNLRPALIYHLNSALVCVDTENQSVLEKANNAYVIVHTERSGLPDKLELNRVLLQRGDYILARSKRLLFHRCS
jgi:4-amino-4-deoxy-L-arabinose transferase-like glycosyltransferase